MTRNAVCLCTDRNMAVPALYVATEAARRARGAYDVHVFAEEGELDDEHRAWMARHGIQAIGALSFPRLHKTGATAGRISPASLIRLVAPELLAGRYDRLLYLDADTEIHGDLAPLFGLDLQGRVLAAAAAGRITERLAPAAVRKREEHFRALGMTEPFRYFNDGLMLIDVARWNAERIGERALDFIERNPTICLLPDEDALNAVLDGHILDLSPIWNFRGHLMELPCAAALAAPVVCHYDGPDKPWKRFGRNRRWFALREAHRRYRGFCAGTPWSVWLARQWTLRDLRNTLAYEGRILLDRLRGRRTPGVPRRSKQRRTCESVQAHLARATFADVEQGITIRNGGRLMLNPAKVRP
ncbi:glycosyltransferase family 8 protein [Dongia deserti]|uniref:glycosyltransferase family 8 protein n=1 Tax=Dongia deserti TaxID=2268030 RepID=UPI0013C44202|nr:glycosyltransferase family 8 protein [Dongia deserti]